MIETLISKIIGRGLHYSQQCWAMLHIFKFAILLPFNILCSLHKSITIYQHIMPEKGNSFMSHDPAASVM